MREIQLSKGMVSLVDDADYDWLSKWSWFATKRGNTWYAARSVRGKSRSDQKTIWMHREILGITGTDGVWGDHINGDGLNNQRYNLRKANRSQNAMNSKTWHGSKSGIKGVTWYKRDSKWEVKIQANKVEKFLGRYADLDEARMVRLAAEKELHGEYARSY